ncbi:two-component system response regulator CreB [Neptunomonas concharum]|uniref:Two-component system response regulator CreB n=1 Tax=Neptunomonas concharum TaxID=1031538 RepID=A0A5P1RBV6_9GAMM|nr:two-component system response regulator CreB [Neptunomonas concharum]QEQ97098.1 two-component system response regulator CreB [Neptunomonas concharum]
MRILIIEDEQSIADTLVYALKQEGFSVDHQLLGLLGAEAHKQNPYDLLILDVGLPDLSGFELCKKIRTFSDAPIIFLTARDQEIDRVVGLEIGADDYVTKPFSPRELVARVKVILRRIKPLTATSELFEHLPSQHLIRYSGHRLELTRYEYGLLATLLTRPEQVFSRDQLMQHVWPDNSGSFDRVIDTHIKGLRAKLRKITPERDPIQTHRGLGYSISLGNTDAN